jgi:hypothetical protein
MTGWKRSHMKTAVELDVMVVGQVPTPYAYVFRPEDGNRLTRLAAVFDPRGEVIHSPCLAYVLRHPSAGAILTGYRREHVLPLGC